MLPAWPAPATRGKAARMRGKQALSAPLNNDSNFNRKTRATQIKHVWLQLFLGGFQHERVVRFLCCQFRNVMKFLVTDKG